MCPLTKDGINDTSSGSGRNRIPIKVLVRSSIDFEDAARPIFRSTWLIGAGCGKPVGRFITKILNLCLPALTSFCSTGSAWVDFTSTGMASSHHVRAREPRISIDCSWTMLDDNISEFKPAFITRRPCDVEFHLRG